VTTIWNTESHLDWKALIKDKLFQVFERPKFGFELIYDLGKRRGTRILVEKYFGTYFGTPSWRCSKFSLSYNRLHNLLSYNMAIHMLKLIVSISWHNSIWLLYYCHDLDIKRKIPCSWMNKVLSKKFKFLKHLSKWEFSIWLELWN
jgi:hypothetical protein